MPGDYGSIRLRFATSMLPPNFNTTEWMTKLKEGIRNLLIYYSLKEYQIEIESMWLMMEDADSSATSRSPPSIQSLPRASHRILKRSELQLMLFVDVNILPLSASAANISIAKNVSHDTEYMSSCHDAKSDNTLVPYSRKFSHGANFLLTDLPQQKE